MPATTNGAMRHATFAPSKKRPGSTSRPIARDQPRSPRRSATAASGCLTLDVLSLEVPLRAHSGGPDAPVPCEPTDGRDEPRTDKDLYSVPSLFGRSF